MLGGTYLGSGERDEVYKNDEGKFVRAHGWAFFCCTCGIIWARAPINDLPTQVEVRPCKLHGSHFYDWAGSMYIYWDSQHNNTLPPELIKREFLLALEHYERYCKQGDITWTEDPSDGGIRVRQDLLDPDSA